MCSVLQIASNFPKIVICADSTHSRKKLLQFFPNVSSELVERLYGHEIPRHNRDIWVLKSMYPDVINRDQLKSILLRESNEKGWSDVKDLSKSPARERIFVF